MKIKFPLTHGTASIFAIASGYEIKASPVPPEFITLSGVTFKLWAKLPKIPKIVVPESNDVKVSKVVTIKASLKKNFNNNLN